MSENVHRIYIADRYSFVRETIESQKKADGVRVLTGMRLGQQTREGFCYEFNPAKFTLGEALAWLEAKKIVYRNVEAAQPVADFAKGGSTPPPVKFWYEACKVGEFEASDDGSGKPGKVQITLDKLKKAVSSVKAGARSVINKLTHDPKQLAARELFGSESGMGKITDARIIGDTLELFTEMPKNVADMVRNKILRGRSVELHPETGDLYACAWLGFSEPAVSDLAPVQMAADDGVLRGDVCPPALLAADGSFVLLEASPLAPGSPGAQEAANSNTGTAGDQSSDLNSDSKEKTMSDTAQLQAAHDQALERIKKIQLGRVKDSVKRAVDERRIEPGQAEEWTTKLSKVVHDEDLLDSSIAILLSFPQREERNKGKANPNQPDTTGADGLNGNGEETEKLSAVERVMLASQALIDKGSPSVMTDGEPDPGKAFMLVLTRDPKLREEYEAETHRYKSNDDEGGER